MSGKARKMMTGRRWASILVLALLVAGTGMNTDGCPSTTPTVPTTPDIPNGGPEVLDGDHVLGEADAPVTVVEYSDLECGFCGSFHRMQFPGIKTDFIDTGKVRFVYRHFPLDSIHPNARGAAEASECAAQQDMFFEFIDAVFADQSALSAADLRQVADDLGLDLDAYDTCVAAAATEILVNQDVNSGNASNVASTPTFFVNGEVANLNDVRETIENELVRLGVDD